MDAMHTLINVLTTYPISTTFAFFCIFGVSAALRRLYFHPLSIFPGPRMAAITSLYRTYYEVMKGGKMLGQIHYLHTIYGPVVRIGPNELHFNDHRAYTEIYSVGSHLTKEPKFYKCFGASGSSFGAIDPTIAKERRAFMSSFVSRRAISSLEDVIHQKVDRLVSKLEAMPTIPVNMFLAFRSATLDIITTYMFGHCLDALDYPGFSSPVLLNIQTALPFLWVIKAFPWIGSALVILPSWMGRRLHVQLYAMVYVTNFLVAWLNRVAQEIKIHPDMIELTICHRLLDPSQMATSPFPSMQSIIDESLSILQAGSDTVGNTCTIGAFHVLNDSNIHARLVEELHSIWPDKNIPLDLSVLQNLPYLTAVLKESLRLSHGFVTPLPRVVGPGGARIGGYAIPPKTIVGMGSTFVHLNPTVFPEPAEFRPERWLQPSSQLLNRYLVSFSSGPRMCLGVNVAWAELYIFFGYLFRKLNMQIVETDCNDICTFNDYFVPVYEGRQLHILGKPV